MANILRRASTAVVQLADEGLGIVDNLADGDFITTAAADLAELDEDDTGSFGPADPDTVSQLELAALTEEELARPGMFAKVPETVSSKIDRVFWIDMMRIIACLIVPLVHSKNFAGTYGLESERHPGYFYCGYNKFDPMGSHKYTTDGQTEFELTLLAWLERKYMTGFMSFFFAGGAALFLSMRRVKKFWPSFVHRICYLSVIMIVGSLLCVIPLNVIYYGARGAQPWQVDPTQHLGFLLTLLGFTVACTPAAWGMIKQSFVGWLITVVVIVLFSFVFVGSSITGRVPWEVSLMWFGSVINLMWMLVSSYITYLRDWRFPGVVLLSVGTWIIPESIDAIWDMRSTGAGNIVASLSLIVSYYLIPFVAGFCVVAFPTKMSVNRTYVKFQLTVIFFIITSAWMDPVSPVGWIEAWSIRTFDLRMQRGMYTMASWWVVILLYNMLKSMNICPYPKTIALMNKYTLFLYVFHPLFLAILGCYVFAYTNGINIFLEVICLYLFSLAGCFIIFLVVFIALPLLVRFIKGKAKARHSRQQTHEVSVDGVDNSKVTIGGQDSSISLTPVSQDQLSMKSNV